MSIYIDSKGRVSPEVPDSRSLCGNRKYLFFLFIGLLLLFSPTLRAQINVITASGTVSASSIATAFTDCASGNCEIDVPPSSVWTMSTTIAPTSTESNILVKCSGRTWNDNGASRGTTTIRWTGGASAMFTLNAVQSFTIDGCDIDNTGTGTKAFSLTGSHDISFKNITMAPTTPWSVSCIQGENTTSANVRIYIEDSYFHGCGGSNGTIDIDRTNIVNITNTACLFSVAGPSCMRFGNAAADVNINVLNSDCETYSTGGATQHCIDVENAGGTTITGNYCELDEDGTGTAGQLCLKLASATDAQVTGNRFDGGATKTTYLVEDNGGTGVVIKGNLFELCATSGIHRVSFNASSDISLVNDLDACSAVMDTVGITATTLLSSAPPNGTIMYCPDCKIVNPCTSGGNGALAKRLNSTWVCN